MTDEAAGWRCSCGWVFSESVSLQAHCTIREARMPRSHALYFSPAEKHQGVLPLPIREKYVGGLFYEPLGDGLCIIEGAVRLGLCEWHEAPARGTVILVPRTVVWALEDLERPARERILQAIRVATEGQVAAAAWILVDKTREPYPPERLGSLLEDVLGATRGGR